MRFFPGKQRFFAQVSIFFNRGGIVDQGHRGIRIEDNRALATQRRPQVIDGVLCFEEPLTANQPVVRPTIPVVGFFDVNVLGQKTVKIGVLTKLTSELNMFITAAELLAKKPTDIPQ